jgi:hypothetical protein
MNQPDKKIILAFLLALKNLEEQDNFSNDEKAALESVGLQLKLDASNWEFIQESIVAILGVNTTFHKLYQEFINQINYTNFHSILSLLPTEEELENELPKGIYSEVRGHFEIEPDLESDEILNVTIVILTTHDPVATTKRLSFLKRIQNFLNKGKPNI